MEIIVRDENTGENFVFTEIDGGYRKAADKIKEIEHMGHRAEGDTGRVWDYVQPSWRETGVVW